MSRKANIKQAFTLEKLAVLTEKMHKSLSFSMLLARGVKSRSIAFRANEIAGQKMELIRCMICHMDGRQHNEITDSEVVRFALDYVTREIDEYAKLQHLDLLAQANLDYERQQAIDNWTTNEIREGE